MSALKATAGPWSAADTMDRACMSYCDPNGCPESHPSGVYVVDGPQYDEGYLAASIPALSNKADADLIAAAPELYAALEEVTEHLASQRDLVLNNGYPEEYAAIDKARAALAKARGEA